MITAVLVSVRTPTVPNSRAECDDRRDKGHDPNNEPRPAHLALYRLRPAHCRPPLTILHLIAVSMLDRVCIKIESCFSDQPIPMSPTGCDQRPRHTHSLGGALVVSGRPHVRRGRDHQSVSDRRPASSNQLRCHSSRASPDALADCVRPAIRVRRCSPSSISSTDGRQARAEGTTTRRFLSRAAAHRGARNPSSHQGRSAIITQSSTRSLELVNRTQALAWISTLGPDVGCCVRLPT
jgi:hypothetical protein